MLKNWKKNLNLLLFMFSGSALALPDIPSLDRCEDMVFHAGFQNHSNPSMGSRGLLGSQVLSAFAEGQDRFFHIYVPSTYDDNEAMPLMIAFHHAAGAGNAAREAETLRDFWAAEAERSGFIVMAPEASGAAGDWVTAVDYPNILTAGLNVVFSDYNIEQNRIYGHGFSSGADHMYTLMLFYNTHNFASFIVSAGLLNGSAINEDPQVPANQVDKIPVYFSVGSSDNILFTVFADFNKFINAGWVENQNLWLDEFTGGHTLDSDLPLKSWQKLCKTSNFR